MFYRKNKVELSPKLKLGVRRAYTQNQLLKYSGALFIVLTLLLVANAGRLLYLESQSKAGLKNQPTPQVLDAQDRIQFMEYSVVKEDTIFTVAQKFHIDWTTLVTLNNLTPPLKLKEGQILKVPKP